MLQVKAFFHYVKWQLSRKFSWFHIATTELILCLFSQQNPEWPNLIPISDAMDIYHEERDTYTYKPNANMANHSVGAWDELHESEASQASVFVLTMLFYKSLAYSSIWCVSFRCSYELLSFRMPG